jgi:hypothetical protein
MLAATISGAPLRELACPGCGPSDRSPRPRAAGPRPETGDLMASSIYVVGVLGVAVEVVNAVHGSFAGA